MREISQTISRPPAKARTGRSFCCRQLLLLSIIIETTVNAGCKTEKEKKDPYKMDAATKELVWPTQPVSEVSAGNVQKVPVKRGPAPLFYQVGEAAFVRVLNASTGSVLAQAAASSGTIVSVTSEGGVRIGKTMFVKGPLSQSDAYVIVVEVGGSS